MPLVLHYGDQQLEVAGLVDSGATVNVLPYEAGLRLGAIWEDAKAILRLAGTLGNQPAMPVFVMAEIGEFALTRLAFAWVKSPNAPLILGQTNFFMGSMSVSIARNLSLRSAPSRHLSIQTNERVSQIMRRSFVSSGLSKKQLTSVGLILCAGALAAIAYLSQYPRCWGYPDWQTSPYVLPYPVGRRYLLYQSNCTLGGHHGIYRYSYDFLMPIGAVVTAAREGVVAETLEGFEDGGGIENWVKVRHADGTLAAYSHLHSVSVRVGDHVNAGDPLGLSGNTGRTGGIPHLHFHVSLCSEPVSCGTWPVTFRNTDANPDGLEGERGYATLGYGPASSRAARSGRGRGRGAAEM